MAKHTVVVFAYVCLFCVCFHLQKPLRSVGRATSFHCRVNLQNVCLILLKSVYQVAICLHIQAPARRARRTRAPTRVCASSSGRASAVTAAWRHSEDRSVMMVGFHFPTLLKKKSFYFKWFGQIHRKQTSYTTQSIRRIIQSLSGANSTRPEDAWCQTFEGGCYQQHGHFYPMRSHNICVPAHYCFLPVCSICVLTEHNVCQK